MFFSERAASNPNIMPIQGAYIFEISSRHILLFIWYTYIKRWQNYQLPACKGWSVLMYLFNSDRNINIISTHSKINWYAVVLFSWLSTIITQNLENITFHVSFQTFFLKLIFTMIISISVSRRFICDI